MGVVNNVGFEHFPKQGEWLGKRVSVLFHYETDRQIGGVFVRDDREEPFVSIIRLDDGRHVLTTECQHSPPAPSEPALPRTDSGMSQSNPTPASPEVNKAVADALNKPPAPRAEPSAGIEKLVEDFEDAVRNESTTYAIRRAALMEEIGKLREVEWQRGFVAGAIAYDRQRSHASTPPRDCDTCTEYKAVAIAHAEFPRAARSAPGS